MEAYLNHYERPPPNRLVTRQLESEKNYDEAAWSDDYWEETLAKRKEIADVIDSNKKPPANVFPSTDIRQRKNDKLSKKPSDLSNLGEKNLQTHEPPRLIQPRRHKDLHSSSQHPLSNAGVAAPIAPVDISPPALIIKPSTSDIGRAVHSWACKQQIISIIYILLIIFHNIIIRILQPIPLSWENNNPVWVT